MRLIASIALAVLAALPPFRAAAEAPYRPAQVVDGGALSGTVRIDGVRGFNDILAVTKDPAVCGSTKASPRLRTGTSGGVADAVVYLERITQGKPMPAPARYSLAQRRCEYVPHVLLAPLGSELEIVNDDPILHNVHARASGEGQRSVFNIAQPVRGQRTVVKAKQLSQPGLLFAACDAGHPWMGATIAITPHPYYALTDTSGAFRLDNIPPGNYALVAWHEGIRVVRKEIESGKVKTYVYEEPYLLRQEIVVSPKGLARADFTLTLR